MTRLTRGNEASREMRESGPLLAVAVVVAVAATFLSSHYGARRALRAAAGNGANFLAEEGRCLPGIQLASSLVLRTGVALLGLRITITQVQALGWSTIFLVVASVALTIAAGVLVSRALKLGSAFGTLTGGAVAICGASAALAIASILPKHKHAERDASFTVIGVTALSTLAMILYPIAVGFLGLDDTRRHLPRRDLHDVAQVVGAGYSVSEDPGHRDHREALLRVAMLLPVCVVIGLALHVRGCRRRTPRRSCRGSPSPSRCWWGWRARDGLRIR